MTQDLKDEIRAAENELHALEKNRTAEATDLVSARGRLGRLYLQAQWRKKADELYKKTVDTFNKAKLPRTGGPEAAWAAEAQFWLLEPRYQAAMEVKPAFGKGGKGSEQLALQIRKLRTEIAGEELPAAAGSIAGRKGGLCGDYSALVASYMAVEWVIATAVVQSRLLDHVADALRDAPMPAEQTPEEQTQFQDIVAEQARDLELQAQHLLEAAWADIGRRNLTSPWKLECKRDLNKFLPKQFPLSRVRSQAWLSPTPERLQAQLAEAGLIDDIQGCYDRHLASANDEMLGSVQIQFELQTDGTAHLQGAEHSDPAIGPCISRKWAGRKDFPRVEAPVSARIKISFASL